jgi:tRNA threonylcarbamoyl adenosine modification protein YjeE
LFNLLKTKTNLKQLEIIAKKLANKSLIGDIYLLSGELGAGKTTFIRFFIYSIFARNLIKKPNSIKSPSFPIMINYPVKNFEVFHYDLYRLSNENEIQELNIFENLKENITLIEWPQMIINNLQTDSYFLINLEIINPRERRIKIAHTHNKHLDNEF